MSLVPRKHEQVKFHGHDDASVWLVSVQYSWQAQASANGMGFGPSVSEITASARPVTLLLATRYLCVEYYYCHSRGAVL